MVEFRKYLFPVISVLLFLTASILEHQTLSHQPEKKLIRSFQQTLINQEIKLSKVLDEVEKKLPDSLSARNYAANFSNFNTLFEDKGMGILIFKGQKMVYWSCNYFSFPNLQSRIATDNELVVLPNGIFEARKRTVGGHLIIGFILIKTNYSYENQFLENKFTAPFRLPSNFKILKQKNKSSYAIQTMENHFLLSVLPVGQNKFNESKLYLTAILFLLGLIFLLMALYRRMDDYPGKNFLVKMLGAGVVLFMIYCIHILFGLPAILNHIEVFSARYYALAQWLPSLGDFFLVTSLFFFWCLLFIKEFTLPARLRNKLIIPCYVFVALMYQFAGMMIANLISNSSITFKLNRITDIDPFSISSHLAIALLLFSAFLINLKVLEKTINLINKKAFLVFHIIALPLTIAIGIFFYRPEIYLLALFLSVNLLHSQIKRMHIGRFSLSYSILFISLFSVISLLIIYKTVDRRDIQVQKLMAVTLSSEQDPIAEVFLAKMQNQLNTDTLIPKLLTPPYEELENYLTRNYFDGYFRKYAIQYIPCTRTDNVLIDENISQPCFPHFNSMIEKAGTQIPGSSFYYMNNMEGLVYLGKIHYPASADAKEFSIFITINSMPVSEGIGFPELLMDRSLIKPFRYKYLSYAKYFDDERVDRSGDYTYNYYLQSYNISPSGDEFELRNWDGYNHIIYKPGDKNCIIVSNRETGLVDYLISFPYLFVFYFVFVLLLTIIGNPNLRKLNLPRDLRFKIQVAIISVVLVSLLFVAAGTIYYNIREYKNRHQADLQQKMKSISGEIDNRLNNVNAITPEFQGWLYEELYNLSNIFKTDINIYDVKGELIASSRPEIFRIGISSDRMNAKAFYELSEKYQLNYFQPESIGNLSYLSAYEPIMNNQGDYLGYLNLPYFTRQDELRQNISTFIVAFINLYLFLFLASVIVAVFLSNKITLPLSFIREKMKGIQLGKKNEQIHYPAEDEIGALVREYNHKVEELAESAELLARSERETAWREMAKQVAHEIKNPLTPMKLNIQYLQRAKAEGKEHYDAFFDRVTRNLIEQIDTLSGIATEFSNFAQIPKARNEVFDLLEVLRNVCALFETSESLRFTFTTGNLVEVQLFADKEQISRAFLNLVKNGIQSIPAEQTGEIGITVRQKETTVLVAISDNGTGISPQAQTHLFEPNFTTKTSGMGLGLSIVQNIIQNFGGKITYETSSTNGTSFFVEIPRYEFTAEKALL